MKKIWPIGWVILLVVAISGCTSTPTGQSYIYGTDLIYENKDSLNQLIISGIVVKYKYQDGLGNINTDSIRTSTSFPSVELMKNSIAPRDYNSAGVVLTVEGRKSGLKVWSSICDLPCDIVKYLENYQQDIDNIAISTNVIAKSSYDYHSTFSKDWVIEFMESNSSEIIYPKHYLQLHHSRWYQDKKSSEKKLIDILFNMNRTNQMLFLESYIKREPENNLARYLLAKLTGSKHQLYNYWFLSEPGDKDYQKLIDEYQFDNIDIKKSFLRDASKVYQHSDRGIHSVFFQTNNGTEFTCTAFLYSELKAVVHKSCFTDQESPISGHLSYLVGINELFNGAKLKSYRMSPNSDWVVLTLRTPAMKLDSSYEVTASKVDLDSAINSKSSLQVVYTQNETIIGSRVNSYIWQNTICKTVSSNKVHCNQKPTSEPLYLTKKVGDKYALVGLLTPESNVGQYEVDTFSDNDLSFIYQDSVLNEYPLESSAAAAATFQYVFTDCSGYLFVNEGGYVSLTVRDNKGDLLPVYDDSKIPSGATPYLFTKQYSSDGNYYVNATIDYKTIQTNNLSNTHYKTKYIRGGFYSVDKKFATWNYTDPDQLFTFRSVNFCR